MARGAAARKTGTEEVAPQGPAAPASVSDLVLNRVRNDFEDLGLNGYQARVLVALLRVGSAPPPYLAQLANVHRTSAYPVLEELRSKGLAFQLPGKTAVWSTPGHDEVLARLLEAQEERVRALQEKQAETAAALARIVPDESSGQSSVPHIQVVSSAAQARSIYERLLAEAEDEFLVLNRPPYSVAADRTKRQRTATDATSRDEVNQGVLDALDRGVSFRVLYQAAQWDDPDAESFRSAMGVYHDAGVDGRVVDELPMKLVIADRQNSLLALADPVLPEVGFPTNLFIEHPGYAGYQAAAFDALWADARPIATASRRTRVRRT